MPGRSKIVQTVTVFELSQPLDSKGLARDPVICCDDRLAGVVVLSELVEV